MGSQSNHDPKALNIDKSGHVINSGTNYEKQVEGNIYG